MSDNGILRYGLVVLSTFSFLILNIFALSWAICLLRWRFTVSGGCYMVGYLSVIVVIPYDHNIEVFERNG